jgi:hypothetical protein
LFNKLGDPHPSTVETLAEALGVQVKDLLGGPIVVVLARLPAPWLNWMDRHVLQTPAGFFLPVLTAIALIWLCRFASRVAHRRATTSDGLDADYRDLADS